MSTPQLAQRGLPVCAAAIVLAILVVLLLSRR
jgi:hypothetical protein